MDQSDLSEVMRMWSTLIFLTLGECSSGETDSFGDDPFTVDQIYAPPSMLAKYYCYEITFIIEDLTFTHV